jgi:hypothetical protein
MHQALITAVYVTLFIGARAVVFVDPDVFKSQLTDPAPDLSGVINIEGLLLGVHSGSSSLYDRQQYVCPDPAGQSCSATKCCRSGENCVSSYYCPNVTETCALLAWKL